MFNPNGLFFAVVVRGPVDQTKTLRSFESCRSEEDGTRCVKDNFAYTFGHVCKLIFGQTFKLIFGQAFKLIFGQALKRILGQVFETNIW